METQEIIDHFERLRCTAKYPVFYLTGQAGTGKTYTIKQAIEQQPNFAQLAASTGIAGVNLGTTTINQVLKYFNTDSLLDAYQSGQLTMNLRKVRKFNRFLVIDEASMIPHQQLDIFLWALDEINNDVEDDERLGLILIGDFCLGYGTKVMMADGSLKVVEDIKAGDQVMGPDSKPRNVLRTTTGLDTLYQVNQTNGDSYVVNSKHPIVLRRSKDGKASCDGRWPRYPDYADNLTLTAPELLLKSDKFRSCFFGYKAGVVKFPVRQAPTLDPYFVGLWLGDGDKDAPRITTADPEIVDYLESLSNVYGLNLTISGWDRTSAVRIGITHGKSNGNIPNPIRTKLSALSLFNSKHIPDDYLYAIEAARLDLLAGLIDSDGSFTGNRYTIACGIEKLAHQIKQLADQLGFRSTIQPVKSGPYANNPNKSMWRISIGGDTWRIPCKVARKVSNPRSLGRTRIESKVSIERLGRGLYAGFETDGDHLFLLADGTVTHNCQLPPVPGNLIVAGKPVLTKDGQRNVKEPTPWAFKSELWSRFEEEGHIIKLEKIYRQSDPTFLNGINAIRKGLGKSGVSYLAAAGVEFTRELDNYFDGTTIVGKNEEVDRINKIRLNQLEGKTQQLPSTRWWAGEVLGWKQPSEWQYIPEQLELKLGAYVMILSNLKDPLTGRMEAANGDCGWVREITQLRVPVYGAPDPESDDPTAPPTIISEEIQWVVRVELVRRPDELVTIPVVKRNIESRHDVDDVLKTHPKFNRDEAGNPRKIRNSMGRSVWCLGTIEYFPLRLAYATTCHKSQGLSLDRIQIDPRGAFMGQPAMCYVSLSRGRTPDGIKIVGNSSLFAERVNLDPAVRHFV